MPSIGTPISALQHVRRMRGGTQSHLMRCSDERYYVVKFKNNPQGIRVLANELLASILASKLGLPVPETAIIDVDARLIRHTEDLVIQLEHGRVPCLSGLCFGSRYPCDPVSDSNCLPAAVDLMPSDLLYKVSNITDFVGMLVFDKWTGNTDDRQSIFLRQGQSSYRAWMIDHGSCFNGMEWNFPDRPRVGVYFRGFVYDDIRELKAFDWWISRIEQEMTESVLASAFEAIPPEWYAYDEQSILLLLDVLDHRRTKLRKLISATVTTLPKLFPNCKSGQCPDVTQSASACNSTRSQMSLQGVRIGQTDLKNFG